MKNTCIALAACGLAASLFAFSVEKKNATVPVSSHTPTPKPTLHMETRFSETLTQTIKAERLTKENFAPFGVVLSPEGRERLPINSYGDKADIFKEGFETDRPTEWLIVRFKDRGNKVLYVERHFHLTQTFIPLGGTDFLMVVAKPDARLENNLPALSEIHAFIVPGNVAVQIHKGTWHENPIPLTPELNLLVSAHQNLAAGHQASSENKSTTALQADVDKRKLADYNLELLIDTH